jgi:hypothetical protein
MFWVISVYFNIRNTLPKSGTLLLGHSVCMYIQGVLKNSSTQSLWILYMKLFAIMYLNMTYIYIVCMYMAYWWNSQQVLKVLPLVWHAQFHNTTAHNRYRRLNTVGVISLNAWKIAFLRSISVLSINDPAEKKKVAGLNQGSVWLNVFRDEFTSKVHDHVYGFIAPVAVCTFLLKPTAMFILF